ncbi:MAG TPA: SRPBCC family protein [Kofleriaceae bacterium]
MISRQSRRIPAPLTVLWRLHIGIPQWPEWQRDIETATLTDKLVPGSSFTWKMVGAPEPITSTLSVLENERRTVWAGTAMGIEAITEWKFTAERGGTLVEVSGSWSGEAAVADQAKQQKNLDDSLERWLGYLAERTAQRRAA